MAASSWPFGSRETYQVSPLAHRATKPGAETGSYMRDCRTKAETPLHRAARVKRAFLDAWTADRLHHAWLIEGPRGIGKATLAYRIARFVLLGRKAADVQADLERLDELNRYI